MVRVGPEKVRRALARVAMVDQHGEVLLDRWVRPEEPVTDYRTPWSGVRAGDLEGPLVLELADAQALVAGLLQGRLLVGHSVDHDLEVLRLEHPAGSTRDTAKYPPFMTGRGRSRKSQPLRKLAASELGLDIQEGEHSPVEDARAAMKLYLRHRAIWEQKVASKELQGPC
ncbi:ribonuclease H-like domain-containing protein [Haematococcus lacustris]